ncbi:MAG: hypothetical protein L6V93_11070 [Clostridiales bacterium]|nr:MAG: hypothetical protein L6V93_11070 [Clostridiales bacterium]
MSCRSDAETNRLRAMFLGICEESEYKNLKEISSLADDYVYFNVKTASLIKIFASQVFRRTATL